VDLSRREMRTRSIRLADLILREGQGRSAFMSIPGARRRSSCSSRSICRRR
jgi:hypothetical protein